MINWKPQPSIMSYAKNSFYPSCFAHSPLCLCRIVDKFSQNFMGYFLDFSSLSPYLRLRLLEHQKWPSEKWVNTEIVQSHTWDIFVWDTTYSIVTQWSVRSYLIESRWSMLYPVQKCLIYKTAQSPYCSKKNLINCSQLAKMKKSIPDMSLP